MVPLIFAAIGAILFYKLGQALDDEEYAGSVVPPHVRDKKIQQHVDFNGHYCTRCGKRRLDFEIDHIIPIARDGRNSWHNTQVLCTDCNRRKGTTYSFLEGFRGRMK
ncbi:MAG: HNH endonuclease [Ignavibacteriales bacterium]|nr:HNH endonuclease [Ignavibacteriales bacterium]